MKLKTKEDSVMQWNMQLGNMTNNLKVKMDLTWPEFSKTQIVTWECHADDSAKGRYNMILGRDLQDHIPYQKYTNIFQRGETFGSTGIPRKVKQIRVGRPILHIT